MGKQQSGSETTLAFERKACWSGVCVLVILQLVVGVFYLLAERCRSWNERGPMEQEDILYKVFKLL